MKTLQRAERTVYRKPLDSQSIISLNTQLPFSCYVSALVHSVQIPSITYIFGQLSNEINKIYNIKSTVDTNKAPEKNYLCA